MSVAAVTHQADRRLPPSDDNQVSLVRLDGGAKVVGDGAGAAVVRRYRARLLPATRRSDPAWE
jgi:hypothetical protein